MSEIPSEEETVFTPAQILAASEEAQRDIGPFIAKNLLPGRNPRSVRFMQGAIAYAVESMLAHAEGSPITDVDLAKSLSREEQNPALVPEVVERMRDAPEAERATITNPGMETNTQTQISLAMAYFAHKLGLQASPYKAELTKRESVRSL